MPQAVHEKIQELLTWCNMSQYDLADKAGIAKGSIGGYVSGKTKISLKILNKIADGFGVSPWVLLNGAPLPATNMDLTTEEQQLIVDYRHFSKAQREIILATTQAIKKQNQERK